MIKKSILIAGALTLGLTMAGCGTQTSAPANNGGSGGSTTGDTVKTYKVGTDAAYAPFESVNDKKQIVGFDIDVVKAVAEKGGFKVEFVNTPWDGIFTSLQNGDRDILVSAITITDKRKADIDFSAPYFEAKQLIAVPNNSTVAKFDDLKNKKVGVQSATTGDEVVKKLMGDNSPNIKRFDTTPLALQELENGGVDAVVADNGVVVNYTKNNAAKGFKTVEDNSFDKESYGIAVKKGNKEVMDKVNAGLKKIQEDGTYNKIYEQYFGKK